LLGAKFHIAHLLSGDVAQKGSQLRLHLALTEAISGVQEWSGTYEIAAEKWDNAQREVVRALIPKLRLDVNSRQLAGMRFSAKADAEAYKQYLLGRYHAARRDTDSLRESIACFERSLAIDPQFTAARGALALSLHLISPKDGIPRAQYIARSSEEAQRALRTDDSVLDAHLALGGNLQFWNWDWSAAEGHYRRAIEVAPASATAHHWYSRLLYPLGRFDEAQKEIDHALELDPLDRSLQIARGTILLDQGHIADAVAQYRMVEAADPGHSNVYIPLSCGYEAQGDLAASARAAERGVALTGGASFAISQLGHVEAIQGRLQEAKAHLAELERRYYNKSAAATEVAMVYLGLRDEARSLEWMERGIPDRDTVLTVIQVDPQFKVLQSSPRFGAIVRQVGLVHS
jgi:tetratricopeptide (TPR) repeat protein